MNPRCVRLLAFSLALPALTGCFRNSDPPQFYMLTAVAVGQPRATPLAAEPLIGLGPIRIPAYLDRDPIVTAVSPHEYRLSDNHRWAERLDVTLARVSAENLSRLIPSERIVMHPWPREPKPDIQVSIDIQDLYVDQAGTARLDALWTLRADKGIGLNRSFSCRLPASVADYAQMVDAQSRCLARLNRDIADVIRASVSGSGTR
ncbi:MAG: membrane integrity-associated transporter subunit PqiC [Gammaproteobacteria bacterium]|nr:membrane integrity-associated transporter subunit PqiC [Gammaproteobacteria bacterium]